VQATHHCTVRDSISGIGASDPSDDRIDIDQSRCFWSITLYVSYSIVQYVLFSLHLAMRVLALRPTKPPTKQRLVSSRRPDVLYCAVQYIIEGAKGRVVERCRRVGMEAQHLQDTACDVFS
jgi:hypothetical protein